MTKKELHILNVREMKRDFNELKNNGLIGYANLLRYKEKATNLLEEAKWYADNQFDLSKEQKFLINFLLKIEREILEYDFL